MIVNRAGREGNNDGDEQGDVCGAGSQNVPEPSETEMILSPEDLKVEHNEKDFFSVLFDIIIGWFYGRCSFSRNP